MRLSDFTQNRDNNFNLIRIAAAYAVLVTHSFAIAIGSDDAEPFRHTLGMTIGSIAVDIFFLTSGFLVTASLLTRQSAIEFVWARVLRIFPALLVMLLLTVLGLGLFFTTVSWPAYFADPKTHTYFLKCLTLFSGVRYELPGVFESNPYKRAVNGSLWTMPNELKMYAILVLIWVSLSLTARFRLKSFKITIVSGTLLAGLFVILGHLNKTPEGDAFLKLFFMFFSGASFYILKDRIILSRTVFYIFLAALILATFNKNIFFIVYVTTLTYILFFVAYVPSGFIRAYNRLGDYSYGVYLYAFPVQQSTAALLPGVSVLTMVIISSVVTLLFAMLSWHFLEKHSLKLKGHSVNYTIKILKAISYVIFFPKRSPER